MLKQHGLTLNMTTESLNYVRNKVGIQALKVLSLGNFPKPCFPHLNMVGDPVGPVTMLDSLG